MIEHLYAILSRSAYIVWCAGFSAIDTRTDARNVNKEVIEMSSSNDSKPSFQVAKSYLHSVTPYARGKMARQ